MDSVKVEVRGIRELSSAFRKVDAEFPKQLKAKLTAVAETVASAARFKVPHRTGRAASSVKARGRTSGGSIAFGGSRAEYFPWLTFGGRVGINHSVVRARVKPDRYIYTTIIEKTPETRKAIDLAIKEVMADAGFESHG